MTGYQIYDHFIDALDKCANITKESYPKLHSFKTDSKMKQKGNKIAKVLTTVNQRKNIIFVVQIAYCVHVYFENSVTNSKPIKFNFEHMPKLQEVFDDIEAALVEKTTSTGRPGSKKVLMQKTLTKWTPLSIVRYSSKP
jgi:hypothetical protein